MNEEANEQELKQEAAPDSEPELAVEPELVAEPPSESALAEASRAIESIVLVATDPVEEHVLAQLLELPIDAVRAICRSLATIYEEQNRGFQFANVAGGWRYQTHPDLHPYVERYVLEGQSARLSGAALETLAIVAYKQPISRGQVSAIRGVNVDGVLRTLVQRGYVEEIGRDLGPGQASLFGTTDDFLDRLGLASIDDLPPLGDFVPSAEVVEALENTLRADPEDDIVVEEPANADQMVTVAEPALVEQSETIDLDAAFDAVAEAMPAPEADAISDTTSDVF